MRALYHGAIEGVKGFGKVFGKVRMW